MFLAGAFLDPVPLLSVSVTTSSEKNSTGCFPAIAGTILKANDFLPRSLFYHLLRYCRTERFLHLAGIELCQAHCRLSNYVLHQEDADCCSAQQSAHT
jgi:hypothetical protein